MSAALVELHVFASSWYDPGDNGFDISDALDIALVIAAIYGGIKVLVAIVRKVDELRDRRHQTDVKAIMAPVLEQQTAAILASVKNLTQSIEPGYENNGTSLTDVSLKVDRAIALGEENHAAIVDLGRRLTGVEDEQARQGALPDDTPPPDL